MRWVIDNWDKTCVSERTRWTFAREDETSWKSIFSTHQRWSLLNDNMLVSVKDMGTKWVHQGPRAENFMTLHWVKLEWKYERFHKNSWISKYLQDLKSAIYIQKILEKASYIYSSAMDSTRRGFRNAALFSWAYLLWRQFQKDSFRMRASNILVCAWVWRSVSHCSLKCMLLHSFIGDHPNCPAAVWFRK